ncbi:MAG: glycoside hydrolase family 16 protein [Prevotella sp.]|jgi:beta-glucanase (GH16 family)|nr:glycoside hydrolase family 16 protein [Prevotella sp.]
MKNTFIPVLVFSITLCFLFSCQSKQSWKLVWEDNFDQKDGFDEKYWSKIPRDRPDWANYMSDNDLCYDMKDSNLILRGIVNPDTVNDKVPYITGGLWTKDKKQFRNGRLEIRAKLGEATGAWPAFWMLPQDKPWPHGGEIDIMEHLNFDSIAYQTVHSHYTFNLNMNDPKPGYTNKIKRNEYNIYTVEMYPDSLVFFINDNKTFTYPCIETDKEGQFPFDYPFYLLIDMQLEGTWVGKANPEELPVEMYIDWVRFYQKPE